MQTLHPTEMACGMGTPLASCLRFVTPQPGDKAPTRTWWAWNEFIEPEHPDTVAVGIGGTQTLRPPLVER